jgi:hypothetical protein
MMIGLLLVRGIDELTSSLWTKKSGMDLFYPFVHYFGVVSDKKYLSRDIFYL